MIATCSLLARKMKLKILMRVDILAYNNYYVTFRGLWSVQNWWVKYTFGEWDSHSLYSCDETPSYSEATCTSYLVASVCLNDTIRKS